MRCQVHTTSKCQRSGHDQDQAPDPGHTKSQAQSYFIAGDNRACDEDKGFAIQPWTKVRFENAGIILEEKRAIAMGNYFFTDLDGNEAKVEYTFGYKLVGDELKIDLHHSSFPYKH